MRRVKPIEPKPWDGRCFITLRHPRKGSLLMPIEEYQAIGCGPSMQRYDAMPPAYRRLVHELNIDPVYEGWRAGLTVKQIRARLRR